MFDRLVQIIVSGAIIFFIFTPITSANAPAPPYSLWFFFDRVPESVQVVECRSQILRRCEQPNLLIQHGTCTASGCLTTQPSLEPTYQFQCAETACLYREPVLSQGARNPVFQLIAQFPNQEMARSSRPFTTDFRSGVAGYRDRHFDVSVQNQALQIQPDERMKPSRWEMFGTALGITQVSELAIALVVLAVLKFERSELARILLWIGFVNLLTFPVVWFFFPSLQPFQHRAFRVFGVFSLLNAIGFSGVLVKRQKTTKSVMRTAIVWFFSSIVLLIVAFIVAILLGYAEFLPSAAGIPSLITLPMSEICVFLWEGWLLSRCQSHLLKWQAYGLSLLMNLFSLGLGLLMLPALQRYG